MSILTDSNLFLNVNNFSILNHLDALNIVKDTPTDYHCTCPSCGDGGFKVEKSTGRYKTFKCGCMDTEQGKKAIIDAIAPLNRNNRPSYSRHKQKPIPKPQPIPAINGKVKIAKLPTIPTDRPEKTNGRITYHYSATQGVDRVEKPDPNRPKGYSKDFYQWHIKNGDRTNGKGDQPWPLYRESEAISADGWLLLVEGEECVETLRGNGIAAMTFQGSSWSKPTIETAFNRLKPQCPGLIFIPDQDQPGQKKAKAIESASADTGLPVIIVPINSIWTKAPDYGDVADIQWGEDMDQAEFIRRLEIEIHAAVEKRSQQNLSKTEEVRLRVKLWLEEGDLITKTLQKAEICSKFNIKEKSFDAIAATLDKNSDKPKAKRRKRSEFMSLASGGSPILLPGVPSVGVTIIGGSPGCGKTTLVMDMTASIIFGDEILGDVPTRTGSVLIVSSDEPHTETQQKLINRGLAVVDDDKLEIISDWDVSQWETLETAVKDVRPACIFLDSFNAIHFDPNFDENTAQAAYTIKKLERLSAKYCIPIVITHHLGKSKDNKGTNELRGSTAIAASCSSIMLMKTMDDGSKLLTQPKIRGSEPLKLMLDMDTENGRFTVIGEGAVDDSTKSLGDRLKAFFTANQGRLFEMTEIKDQFPSEDRKVLTNSLNRLVKRGEIVKRPSKTNVRSKAYGVERTDRDFTSSPEKNNDPPPSGESVKIDDSIPEIIENKGIDDVITVSSPCHHSCHHLSSTLPGNAPMMTNETIENKGVEPPRHHVITETQSMTGGGSDDIADDHAVPIDQTPIDWPGLMSALKAEIDRLGWDKDRARMEAAILLGLEHLPKSVQALSDDQIFTFFKHVNATYISTSN